MPAKQQILVFRFSAMGDVAMTVPVLREFLEQNPEVEVLMVNKEQFKPFFTNISRLHFHAIDPNGAHKGLSGLFDLFRELRNYPIAAVADLHQSLRSRVLTILFKLSGIKTAVIDKGRAEKRKLTRKNAKKLVPLKSSAERYADVLRSLGYSVKLSHQLRNIPEELNERVTLITGPKAQQKWIGISPFAQHAQKIYPLDSMAEIVKSIAEAGHRVFIFGGGNDEREIAEKWAEISPNIYTLIGKLNLSDELNLISNLNLMLSMDSAGMHLASLKGIRVVSVWGATHPFAGFLGYGQQITDCVQIDLYCRPCSIYGNKTCFRGDFACLQQLPAQKIIEKIIRNTIS